MGWGQPHGIDVAQAPGGHTAALTTASDAFVAMTADRDRLAAQVADLEVRLGQVRIHARVAVDELDKNDPDPAVTLDVIAAVVRQILTETETA